MRTSMRWLVPSVHLLASLGAWAADPTPVPQPAPRAGTPWMGVIVDDAVDGGVLVVAVHPDGPAERAGLRGGDILLRVDGREISNREAFVADLIRRASGSSMRLETLRAGTVHPRAVVLGSRSELASSFVPLAPVSPETSLVMAELPAAHPLEVYGLQLADVTPDLREHFGAPAGSGVLVIRVDAEAPVAVSGLRVGDVLLAIDEEPVRTPTDVATAIVSRHASEGGPDSEMKATLVRGGRQQQVAVAMPRVAHAPSDPARPESLREVALEAELRRLRAESDRLARRIESLERALETVRDPPER